MSHRYQLKQCMVASKRDVKYMQETMNNVWKYNDIFLILKKKGKCESEIKGRENDPFEKVINVLRYLNGPKKQ